MTEYRLHPREVKSVLRKREFVDPFFVGKFSFSPYHACAHGCAYCDGRAERYFVEGEFDRDIVVRVNASTILDAELARSRERGTVFIGSGVSDAYQQAEIEGGLMRSCAGVLARRSFPVALLTKSTLPLRDLDIWGEVNSKAGFTLMVSLSLTDERVRSAYEPFAAPVAERLAMLESFRAAGCATGVAAMPLLPGLSDSDDQIGALADLCRGVGVDFVLIGGLTLRPGRQKTTYMETLERHDPQLVESYERLYGENRSSGAPLAAYERDVQRRAHAVFRARGIPRVVPHRLYRDRLPLYDEVDVLLHHMAMSYADRPRAVQRLRAATTRYREWLSDRRTRLGRSRKILGSHIEEELRGMAETKGLAAVLQNDRLAAFLRRIIIDRGVVDPLAAERGVDGAAAG